MVAFFNELVSCYKLYVDWLFRYSFSGVPVGYVVLACIIFGLVVHYILGRVR